MAVIFLVAALSTLLWNRHGPGKPILPKNIGLAEKPKITRSAAAVSNGGEPLFSPQPVVSGSTPPVPLSTTATGPNYHAEEFTHVPGWMPRHAQAVSARADDASLRSDGMVEGTLIYVFSADHAGAIDEITSQLQSAGMRPDPNGTLFSSDDPPRRCEVRTETTPDGGIRLTLSYQGIDHEKGCACPTCGSAAE
jgi:hypothetical protein